MPKVAQYSIGQVSPGTVRTPLRPTMPVSTDFAFLSKGLSFAGGVAIDVQNRINTTSAEEALNNFEKAKNDVLFNPDSGYFNTQGRNAYDNASSTMQTLQKLKNQFGDGLNSQARQMFNKAANQHLNRSGVDIMRHSSKGLRAWEIATIETQVENTMENASLYWNNPKDLKIQRILGEEAIRESAKLTGIGAEATNEKLQTYRSKFISAAVEAATVNSSTEGQKILDDNEDMLEGQDRINLQKAIDKKQEIEKSEFDARQAVLIADRLVGEYDTRREIKEQLDEIEDPEFRKKVMNEAMSRYSRKRQMEQEERGDAFEDVEQFIMQGGSAVEYQTQNPEQWAKLSPGQQSKLTKDQPIQTNWNTYSGLMTMPKEALAKINPVDYFDQLGQTERRSLISAVKTAKGGGSKNEKVDAQVGRTRTAQIKSAVDQIFGFSKDRKEKDLPRVDAFYSLVDSEVRYREDVKGSKLTSAEFTEVLAGFTRDVVKERPIIWDRTIGFEDIPTEHVQALTDQLRAQNIPVTTDNLIRLYDQATKTKKKVKIEDRNPASLNIGGM